MSNYNETKQELLQYIMARTPLVIVNTSERERVERMLRELARERQLDILYYTDAKQVRNLNNATLSYDTQGDPLEYFLKTFKNQRGCTIALGDVRKISEDNVYSRDLLNILYMAKENSGVFILITSDAVWTRLLSFGMIATLDLPGHKERKKQIEEFIHSFKWQYNINWEQEDIYLAATILRGFSEIQIDNILSSEIIRNQGLNKQHISELSDQKQKLYSRTTSVQYIKVTKTHVISGMNHLKSWLEEKRKVFFMQEEILEQYDLTPPKGILLVGVPGCGKSLSAKLIAQEWKLPLFRLDVGAIFDKWVGESEKKMREALQYIENVSPCILWIDEIEKVLATSDTGNETGRRILGDFLFWIQEAKSKVFMVATANDVKALPYELYRKGRFSEIFFAGLPDEEERKEVILYYMYRSMRVRPDDKELEILIELTDQYSYSDIENAIKDVAQKRLIHKKDEVSLEELKEAIQSIIPISRTNPELVRHIYQWGRERAINVTQH
ncbi:MAG: ATPase, central domain protein [Herbinix sp.]|nr:ATPase, central domain protein [Herbinix sp.]